MSNNQIISLAAAKRQILSFRFIVQLIGIDGTKVWQQSQKLQEAQQRQQR
jgi:hypothetical protein